MYWEKNGINSVVGIDCLFYLESQIAPWPEQACENRKGQLWLYQNRPYIFGHYKRDYPQNGFFYLPNEVIFLSNL